MKGHYYYDRKNAILLRICLLEDICVFFAIQSKCQDMAVLSMITPSIITKGAAVLLHSVSTRCCTVMWWVQSPTSPYHKYDDPAQGSGGYDLRM